MITKKLLKSWEACWSDERIDEYFGKRRRVTPKSVAEDTSISASDRLWVLSKCLEHLDESAARGFAVECALSVAHLAPDEDEHRGICASILEIEDLPESEQSAAWSAAASAAWSAAWSATRSAAYSAAESAAYSAANAARSAAESATRSAASAAWSAAESAAESAASAARSAAWSAAESAALEGYIKAALEWLGDYAS